MNAPFISLGKVAQPISRAVAVEPGNEYRTIGVRCWGKGAYERETIDGSQTAAKTLYVVKEKEVLSRFVWVTVKV